jgi:uncharacterized membrane protein
MALAVAMGLGLPRLEHRFLANLASTMSAAAAMTVASSVASGMMALTAIVFSLAFLMIQFSATAYSPRLVLWIASDPVLWHAMGIFSATFLYALMMAAWVDRWGSGRVPLVSVWLIFALLVASMGTFVALIERISRLQVNRMLIFTGDQGRDAIAELYPAADAPAPPGPGADMHVARVTQMLTHAGRPQVVQAIRFETLVTAAAAADVLVEVLAAIGDTVVERTPIVRVTGGRLDESVLTGAIDAGDERTFEQDPKYAIRLLVDIAIRALSPALNDPTTAVQALDQIEDLLIRIGNRRLDIGTFADRAGRVRLVVPFPDWDDFLRLAFDEIRMYGANSVQVMRRMRALMVSLGQVVPADRLPALRRWERRLEESVQQSFSTAEQRREASVVDRQGLGIGRDRNTGEDR